MRISGKHYLRTLFKDGQVLLKTFSILYLVCHRLFIFTTHLIEKANAIFECIYVSRGE